MKPKFITFTGADDKTDLAEMRALAKDFPVEFGILYSTSKRGEGRYPSNPFKFSGENLRLSLHICGQAARGIAEGRLQHWNLSGFHRVQINGMKGSDVNLVTAAKFAEDHGVDVILQSGDRDLFPQDRRVSWLFDLSGGKGDLPPNWPRPVYRDQMVGYAGGLGPDTGAHFKTISDVAWRAPYWIDMETKVRNANDEFDLGLCRQVCEQVYG